MNLPDAKYATVVIDPPWPINWQPAYSSKGGYKALPYKPMSLRDIAGLPMLGVCEKDAWVFLWTTQGFIPQAYEVLTAWGFRYRTMMVWGKPLGPRPVGMPQYNCEFILLASRGAPAFCDTKGFTTANFWRSKRNHSEKPEEFYELLRRVTPEPRLDMFARRQIEGFDAWGDQAPAQSHLAMSL